MLPECEKGLMVVHQGVTVILNFDIFRDACYHVAKTKVTAASAEVQCGLKGGRLASFVQRTEIDNLKSQLQTTVSFTEMWIGKKCIQIG